MPSASRAAFLTILALGPLTGCNPQSETHSTVEISKAFTLGESYQLPAPPGSTFFVKLEEVDAVTPRARFSVRYRPENGENAEEWEGWVQKESPFLFVHGSRACASFPASCLKQLEVDRACARFIWTGTP